mmetsp:Transcript_29005/g.42623  ORF Transcript_29005/g.42623 Transcript_29005/m.42623 type:complete len:201 (+) Transcript_29005:1380-1982(+)
MATSTQTGFLIPALDMSSLIPRLPAPPPFFPAVPVALKMPVRLILGRRPRMAVNVRSKPISNNTSASSRTKHSNSERSNTSYRVNTSSILPGVPMIKSLPSCWKVFKSSRTGLAAPPPTKSKGGEIETDRQSPTATSYVCLASSLVGLRTKPPTCLLFSKAVRRKIISSIGMRKASVLPLPVTALTATSLLVRNNGMVAA